MDRKQSREIHTRASRLRKRKFPGNIHTREAETTFASTSAKKLSTSRDDEVIINPSCTYRIIAFLSVFTEISQLVVCKECKGEVRFGESSSRGLGFKIVVQCKCRVQYINSCPLIDNKAYEVNRRMVLIMRLLGIGREGINLFCGLMDISQGLSTHLYYAAMDNIYCGAKAVYDLLTKKAIDEEKIQNAEHGNPMTDISVSGGGTWKKRGFSSLFGITTLIGKYTGKVVDLVVKSSFCHACNLWKSKSGTEGYIPWIENHAEACTANHKGSAGKMEVDSVKEMFRRSLEIHQVRYAKYIGDGDTKTFKALLDDKPYGEDLTVEKKECVGHVEKRMGSRLRNLKKTNKLGGKGKLTDKLIKELTIFYGLAIRRHPDSVDDMYNAVWATYYHKISTDENPQHMHCPVGSESWCKWRKSEAENTLDKFNHETPLHKDVADAIKPIYNNLSSRELLERCLGGGTQNNNESYNSTVWRLAPKHLHCGSKTIEIAAHLATGIFNEGFSAILKTMTTIGIVIGHQAKIYAEARDERRLERSSRRSLEATKEARTARRSEQMHLNDFFEEEEGIFYGPGIAD